jgi:hypothetical protein
MIDVDDPITLQLLWNRLVFITDQADIALGRTAFSSVIRESHDYVTVLLDPEGNSLAQCSQSIPAFIGSLPLAAKEFLKVYPVPTLEPGDVLFTNDPAIGTGHLNDGVMIAPVYRRGRLVALVATSRTCRTWAGARTAGRQRPLRGRHPDPHPQAPQGRAREPGRARRAGRLGADAARGHGRSAVPARRQRRDGARAQRVHGRVRIDDLAPLGA